MSKATIDFEKKEITLTIPYESAQDMAMAIEVAQDACDKRQAAIQKVEPGEDTEFLKECTDAA